MQCTLFVVNFFDKKYNAQFLYRNQKNRNGIKKSKQIENTNIKN